MHCIELTREGNPSKKMLKVSYMLGSQEIRKLSLNVQFYLCLCSHYGTVLIEINILLRKSEALGYAIYFP